MQGMGAGGVAHQVVGVAPDAHEGVLLKDAVGGRRGPEGSAGVHREQRLADRVEVELGIVDLPPQDQFFGPRCVAYVVCRAMMGGSMYHVEARVGARRTKPVQGGLVLVASGPQDD